MCINIIAIKYCREIIDQNSYALFSSRNVYDEGEMFARVVEVNNALTVMNRREGRERKRNRNDLSKGNEKLGAGGRGGNVRSRSCVVSSAWQLPPGLAQLGKYQVSSKRRSIRGSKPSALMRFDSEESDPKTWYEITDTPRNAASLPPS